MSGTVERTNSQKRPGGLHGALKASLEALESRLDLSRAEYDRRLDGILTAADRGLDGYPLREVREKVAELRGGKRGL